MLTAALATKLIRQILGDYNYWPESESDSPLKVVRSKTALDEKAILSRDASMRRAAVQDSAPATAYKPPVRTVQVKTLDQVLKPLVRSTLAEIQAQAPAFEAGTGLDAMQKLIEKCEYFVQLYSAFKQLANPKISYVVDGNNTSSDPYTGFFISGESTDGEVVIAQTLLVQT
ncbi:MAG: hypothetical protein QQW96_03915 [Tychonema bourrellyi B0820]|nr:hypothetical protein [Tychonema bourrellyi B0820]PJE45215.1 MAG: hypothetical protein CUR32_01035 [Flavobacterium sp.] [Flavobacterium sp. FEMGT703F]